MIKSLGLIFDFVVITALVCQSDVAFAGDDSDYDTGEINTLDFEKIELQSSKSEVLGQYHGANSIGNGRTARWIYHRGIDARYNSTYIDGSPFWNANRSRRTPQFDMYPSLALNNVQVYKSITPDLDANSIGGHVNANTWRAFDKGTKPYFESKIQLGHFEQNGEPDGRQQPYRFDAIGKFTFGSNDQFGAVVSVDLQRRENTDNISRVKEGYRLDPFGLFIDVPRRQTLQNATLSQNDIQRRGVFAKLETRETEKSYGFVSFNYYNLDDIEDRNRVGHFLDPANLVPDSITSGIGTFAASAALVRNVKYENDSDHMSVAMGVDYRLGEDDKVELRASYSKVDTMLYTDETQDFINRDGARQLHTYDATGDDVVFGFPGADPYTSAASFVTETGLARDRDDELNDQFTSVNLDYTKNISAVSTGLGFKTGLSARRLDREFDRRLVNYGLADYTLADNGLTTVDSLTPIFINVDAYWDFIRADGAETTPDFENLGADYELIEDVIAGYGMANYSGKNFQVTGGLRAEYTDVTIDGFSGTDLAIITPISAHSENNYTELLPSIHLLLDPVDNIHLRLSYAKTMARPNFEDFSNGSSVTYVNTSQTRIKFADPNIGPRLSDNYDASVQYNFDNLDGFLSLGLFYKNIEDETFNEVTRIIDPANAARTIQTETVRDTSSAETFGTEIQLKINKFAFLPKPFDGLGMRAYYAYTSGEWNTTRSDGTVLTVDGLRNQPDHYARTTLLYRWRGRFGTNLDFTYRGRSFTGNFGVTPIEQEWRDSLFQVDASAYYSFSKSLSVHAVARNINDTVTYKIESGLGADLLARSIKPGRQFWLGLKYKF